MHMSHSLLNLISLTGWRPIQGRPWAVATKPPICLILVILPSAHKQNPLWVYSIVLVVPHVTFLYIYNMPSTPSFCSYAPFYYQLLHPVPVLLFLNLSPCYGLFAVHPALATLISSCPKQKGCCFAGVLLVFHFLWPLISQQFSTWYC